MGRSVRGAAGARAPEGPAIGTQLLEGPYRPRPVLRVELPKAGAGGGMRALGIPTVLDRFIQQAVLQVPQPSWDPTFSDASFGFRPGRSGFAARRSSSRLASPF